MVHANASKSLKKRQLTEIIIFHYWLSRQQHQTNTPKR